jgi:hypothetical protein
MINSSDLSLDFAVSSVDTVALTPEQIEQAAQLADVLPPGEQQWQTYLNTLARLGFELWLNQRSPELVLEQSDFHNILNAICQLKIGEFKLCLLTQGTLDDGTIAIPRAAIAHLYVLVVVDEEQEQFTLGGVMRYDRLRDYLRSGNSTLQPDRTDEIPLTEFDPDVNHLLLYLRCLEPSAIQLPCPQEGLAQPLINVGLWLRGELDEMADRLSWLLLPTPELATAAFRSLPILDLILGELREQGLLMLNTARGASQDFNIGETLLRLYALTWLLEDSNEWALLLILGTPTDRPLPEGLKLQLQDGTGLLSEQEIYPNSDRTYLYLQIVGEPYEQFTLTIALANGDRLTLPPFTFYLESP